MHYSYPGAVPPAAVAAAVGAPSSYYDGGGGEDPHSLAVKEAIRQYGVDPHSYGPVSISLPLSPAPPSLHCLFPKDIERFAFIEILFYVAMIGFCFRVSLFKTDRDFVEDYICM